MKRLTAAAFAMCALATSPAFSADLFGTPEMELNAPAPLTEVGSNWYIRGDVGLGLETDPTVNATATLLPTTTNVFTPPGDPVNAVGIQRGNNVNIQNAYVEAGVGYRFNNWLRFEATYGFRHGSSPGVTQATKCQETATAVNNYNGTAVATPAGYLWDPVNCNGVLNSNQYHNLVMGSVYVDLGHYWGVTPYLGAGAGVNVDTYSGSTQFYDTNGIANINTTPSGSAPLTWVTPTGTLDATGHPIYQTANPYPNVLFGQQNWARHFRSVQYSMAGALMAGFGYQLTPSATLDVGYRLLDANVWGGSGRTMAQQLHIGIRYMAD